MKKFFIAFALIIAGSISNLDLMAQKKNTCVLHIETVNFKRPKFDCQRGFGLCVRAHWDVIVNDLNSGSCSFGLVLGDFIPRIEKDEVYAGVAVSGSKLWLVVPKEIREMEVYKGEDLSFLPIEEKIVLYAEGKPYRVIRPQKAPMREEGGYLIYEVELTN